MAYHCSMLSAMLNKFFCFCGYHDSWWRHQMETFSTLLAFCAGNSPAPDEFPHKGQWRGALMFCVICALINGWVNNREAGDFRRYHAHYDVIVMSYFLFGYLPTSYKIVEKISRFFVAFQVLKRMITHRHTAGSQTPTIFVSASCRDRLER